MQKVIWGTSGNCPECGQKQLNNAVEVCSGNDCDRCDLYHEDLSECQCDVTIEYPMCSCGYCGEYNY